MNMVSENGPQPYRSQGLEEAKFRRVPTPRKQTSAQVETHSASRNAGDCSSRLRKAFHFQIAPGRAPQPHQRLSHWWQFTLPQASSESVLTTAFPALEMNRGPTVTQQTDHATSIASFDPRRTALLVIDPVNDFLSEGGAATLP